ncbi:MAG: GNAT family N-acetyltransferase [Devosiaceae bacterium]|nr:GNAT family N-acetyltransferase [Devosiaceae bacterium]
MDKEIKKTSLKESKDAGLNISITTTNVIDDIETEWRFVENLGVQSPGQNFDFIKVWLDILDINPEDQYFSVLKIDNVPIIITALEATKMMGVKTLMPFTKSQVGVEAPLVNAKAMAKFSEQEQKSLWQALIKSFKVFDLIYIPYVPDDALYSQLGMSAPADMLYRSEFENWEQCNIEQRTRSRRKHDKQHSAKLNALGDVSFEEIGADNKNIDNIISLMFEQRAQRFKIMGIKNPFTEEQRKFYHEITKKNGAMKVVLHVLRLNDEIIAIRYNIVHQEHMFCLISSMSTKIKVQIAAPGKQNLLRVMQTIFDAGTRVYDMGAGLTDEKRHWCNSLTPLRHFYIPLSPFGFIIAHLHRMKKTLRFHIKNSKKLAGLLKKLRKKMRMLRAK